MKYLAVLLLLLPTLLAFAQGNPDLPQSVAPKDIPAGFEPYSIKTDSDGGLNQLYLFGMFSGGSGRNPSRESDIFTVSQVCFTNWNYRNIKGDSYLETYSFDLFASVSNREPEVIYRLTYIRKDAIVSFTARPEWTRDRIQALASPQSDVKNARTQTISNLKQLAVGAIMYMGDYDDEVMYVQDTRSAFAVMMPYLKNIETMRSLHPDESRILMNMAVAGTNAASIEMPAETVLFYDEKVWPDGTHLVAFMDGHVKGLSEDEWQRVSQTLHLKLKKNGRPLPGGLWEKTYPGQPVGGG